MKLFHLSLLMIGTFTYGQSAVLFEYDEAGNQKLRELSCVNCNVPSASRIAASNIVEDEDLNKIASDKISYFPNPVLEELHIEWIDEEENHLTSIEVYSTSGQLVKTQKGNQNSSTAVIEFSNLAQGIYSIVMIYSSGERKTIKVIKK